MEKKNTLDLVPMPISELHKRVGTLVHLNWAKPYAKWLLREYYTDQQNRVKAKLETPKTHKKLEVSAACLMVRPGIMETVEQAIAEQQPLFSETVES